MIVYQPIDYMPGEYMSIKPHGSIEICPPLWRMRATRTDDELHAMVALEFDTFPDANEAAKVLRGCVRQKFADYQNQ